MFFLHFCHCTSLFIKRKFLSKYCFVTIVFFSSTIYFQNSIFLSQFSFLNIFVSFIIITFSITNLTLSQHFVVPIFSSEFCFHHQFVINSSYPPPPALIHVGGFYNNIIKFKYHPHRLTPPPLPPLSTL